ncbi:LysR family transcriptional regulator [Actinomadura harenae]|uniref:LysR family transcriptional regulator n=1 Tax=Actinomadura harenae TaxID=2483351 RepID=A0A3M2MBL2_9ACTN|nr:LysR family transcriptional regulator [Actinomadura harenae]RMI46400.1 LysR family transcriptional regulator [Actinomadura harenae]
MELRQLEYFVAVAEELGFARAAERLHVVQPAVSKQIARLERELGVPLFDRSTRHVRITSAGERLLPEIRAVLAAAARVDRIAAGIASGADGVLRIGTSQGLGDRLDQVLDRLAAAAPRLRVRLSGAPLAERLAAVRGGALDAAFVRVLGDAPGLELLPLWTEPLVVVLPAAHPLAGHATLTIDQVAGLPVRLSAREVNPVLHELVTAAIAATGREPRFGPPFTNLQDTLAELAAGPATWTVLYEAATPQVPVGRVAYRRLAGPEPMTYLAVPPGPPSPAVRLLLDACADTVSPGEPTAS